MPLPYQPKRYHEMDRLERKIQGYAGKKNPTRGDFGAVKTVAQVEAQLDAYRMSAKEMTEKQLRDEAHQSARLAEHLMATNDPRPHELCHAHAIVSGAHKGAATQRAIMAAIGMRIDDAHNGCWLPKNTAAKSQMPKHLREAVPHSRIHRYNYYFWLDTVIDYDLIEDAEDLIRALNMIEMRLQAGIQPGYVMNKKGVDLPQ